MPFEVNILRSFSSKHFLGKLGNQTAMANFLVSTECLSTIQWLGINLIERRMVGVSDVQDRNRRSSGGCSVVKYRGHRTVVRGFGYD